MSPPVISITPGLTCRALTSPLSCSPTKGESHDERLHASDVPELTRGTPARLRPLDQPLRRGRHHPRSWFWCHGSGWWQFGTIGARRPNRTCRVHGGRKAPGAKRHPVGLPDRVLSVLPTLGWTAPTLQAARSERFLACMRQVTGRILRHRRKARGACPTEWPNGSHSGLRRA